MIFFEMMAATLLLWVFLNVLATWSLLWSPCMHDISFRNWLRRREGKLP
jgi:hypothetical protein